MFNPIGWNLGKRQIPGGGGRLIVPTARERVGHTTQSLDLETAAQIIVNSGTRFLILGTSTSCGMGTDIQGASLDDIYERVQALSREEGKEWSPITLINTSRSTTAQEAIDRALMGYKLLRGTPFASTLIKLEVFDPETQAPVDDAVMQATERIHQQNPTLEVMPFITKRPDLAKEAVRRFNCPAIRIFGTAIGSGNGIGNEDQFVQVVAAISSTPIIMEGGIGTIKHVIRSLQLGASACLVNAAIATHAEPIRFALELRQAVERRESLP